MSIQKRTFFLNHNGGVHLKENGGKALLGETDNYSEQGKRMDVIVLLFRKFESGLITFTLWSGYSNLYPKQRTKLREPIGPAERLCITLRYLKFKLKLV